MRPIHPGGGSLSRRPRIFVSLTTALIVSAASASFAAGRSVAVLDQNGNPLARAHVRVLGADASAAPLSDGFADDSGRFTLPATTACVIEASLAGFRSVSVPCGSAADVTITLPLAPIVESVLVTATRTAVPAAQLGVSATSFSAEDIERRGSPFVGQLLQSSPGVATIQTGAPGGITSLFVRGGESNYNLVLVDGIPLNEPGGTFNFNTLSTTNLDRVEIVRGANSAVFGSDAMSSVVQLFTKRGRAGAPSASASLEGGSYNTLRAQATASGVTHGLDYSVGAARLSSDNRGPNDRFGNTSLSANVGGALGARTTVRGVLRSELGRSGTPGQTAYGRPDLDAFYEHRDISGGVSLDEQLTPRLHQRVSYSLSTSHQASTDLIADPSYTPSFEGHVAPFAFSDFTFDSATALRRHYASYQADWHVASGPRGDHRLTVVADWNGERAQLDNRMTSERITASRNNAGAAIEHQFLIGRLSTTAGVRVERNDSFGTAAVPRASAVYTLRSGHGVLGDTRLRGAAGAGIKEPTLLQTFSISPYYLGNPNLQPERSRSVEGGVEQRLAGDRAKVTATWFDNRYRNIIGLRPTGGYNSEYFNIGLTRARGLETAVELSPTSALRLSGGYTFTDSAILQSTSDYSPVFAVGQWAFRRPRHSGFVQAAWTWQRLTTDVEGHLIGRFVDSDFSSLVPAITSNPGRTTWDAHAAWRLRAGMTALVTVENLTNRNYQEPLGYLALQRAVRAGLRVGF